MLGEIEIIERKMKEKLEQMAERHARELAQESAKIIQQLYLPHALGPSELNVFEKTSYPAEFEKQVVIKALRENDDIKAACSSIIDQLEG